jgi:hypothetical protein
MIVKKKNFKKSATAKYSAQLTQREVTKFDLQ